MKTYDYLIILDFEATCCDKNPPNPQEIIEFPSVLLDGRTLETVSEFESFVRPVINPELGEFCMELTSITQDQVDGAEPFCDVFRNYLEWLEDQGLDPEMRSGPSYSLVLCGDWDLGTMLPIQFKASGIDRVPACFRRWINIKNPFAEWKGQKARGMAGMLKDLDLELTGRHHRGIDDCRNISKIARRLLEMGMELQYTGELAVSRYPSLRLQCQFGDEDRELVLEKRSVKTLLGVAASLFRRQPGSARLADGTTIENDTDLCDLRSSDQIVFGE